jgi:serine protease
MNDAVQYAVQKGVTVIAAAGNSSSRLPSYPAAYPNVISVSATQYDRTTTFYSNYGPTVDVAAPGGNTRVDQNNDGRPDGVLQETLAHGDTSRHDFSLYMGTSMAAPHVAGVAALLHSRGVTRPDRMEQLLESTATREVPQFEQNRYGAGIIQARAALDAAGQSQTLPAGLLGLALGAGLWMTASKRRLQGGGTSVLFALGASGVAAGLAWLGSSPFGLADCALSQAAGAWVNPVLHVGLHNAAFASMAVPLAAYAVFGGVRNRRVMGALLVGLAGFAAWLLASAALPFADLLGVPGAGLADSLWMLVNAAGAMAIASAALREH